MFNLGRPIVAQVVTCWRDVSDGRGVIRVPDSQLELQG